MEHEVRLGIQSLRKEYPGVLAVNDVSFEVKKGHVHVLIGENGAGKSTLVKMIAGIISGEQGSMTLDGEAFEPDGVLDAQAKGVVMIHQELSIMPNRTVAENVFVGREPLGKSGRMIDVKAMNTECQALLDYLGVDVSPIQKAGTLSIAQQQMIEVAKALSLKSKLLIMDEPTSSLTAKEIDSLFTMIRKLRSEGVSIIYISHRMQELMELADEITVLRDGCYVGTRGRDEIDMGELITMMVGRKIENVYERTYNEPKEVKLSTEDLTGLRFRNVSIDVKAGEIVGMAGLIGAGRTELVKSVFGYDPIDAGKVYLDGKQLNGRGYNTTKAVTANLALLPEDRKHEGLFLDVSIRDNIYHVVMNRLAKCGVLFGNASKEISAKYVEALSIATPSDEKLVGELSGGNQQKVVIGKWLSTNSQVLIFDEPTRGIDVGAKHEIYRLMNDLAKEGAAVLMISSDLPELLGMSDRVYVMKDGDVVAHVHRDDETFTQEGILQYALEGRVS